MFADAEIIYAYARAQAITDGVLVDVTAIAAEAGFGCPVAITRAVHVDCVAWDASNPELQDESGRLWDVVWMASHAARKGRGGSEAVFTVLRVPNERPEREWASAGPVRLRMVIGPGDTAAPVVTIMLEHED